MNRVVFAAKFRELTNELANQLGGARSWWSYFAEDERACYTTDCVSFEVWYDGQLFVSARTSDRHVPIDPAVLPLFSHTAEQVKALYNQLIGKEGA